MQKDKTMQHESVQKLAQAIATGSAAEYMTGEQGYQYPCPYADTPTYDEVVFSSFVEYSELHSAEPVWDAFKAGWLAVSLNPDYSWFSLYYLFLYLRKFSTSSAPPIPVAETSALLVANIKKNQAFLTKDQRWMGRGFPNGLWDNATKMAAIINREFGLSLVLE